MAEPKIGQEIDKALENNTFEYLKEKMNLKLRKPIDVPELSTSGSKTNIKRNLKTVKDRIKYHTQLISSKNQLETLPYPINLPKDYSQEKLKELENNRYTDFIFGISEESKNKIGKMDTYKVKNAYDINEYIFNKLDTILSTASILTKYKINIDPSIEEKIFFKILKLFQGKDIPIVIRGSDGNYYINNLINQVIEEFGQKIVDIMDKKKLLEISSTNTKEKEITINLDDIILKNIKPNENILHTTGPITTTYGNHPMVFQPLSTWSLDAAGTTIIKQNIIDSAVNIHIINAQRYLGYDGVLIYGFTWDFDPTAPDSFMGNLDFTNMVNPILTINFASNLAEVDPANKT